MEYEINPETVVKELVDKLFGLPGEFSVTLLKENDKVKIIAGRPRDFLTLAEVAEEFGVAPQTIRRRYIYNGKLKRTEAGFRREDVNRIKGLEVSNGR